MAEREEEIRTKERHGIEKSAERMMRLSIVFLVVGIVILTLSLFYEFIYKAQEGILGTLIGLLCLLVTALFYVASQIINAIKEVEGNIGSDIRDAKDMVCGA